MNEMNANDTEMSMKWNNEDMKQRRLVNTEDISPELA